MSRNILSMNHWNMEGELSSPYDMTEYCKGELNSTHRWMTRTDMTFRYEMTTRSTVEA